MILLFLALMLNVAYALPIHEYYRSPYLGSMGNAGLATAEGMDALFYNPAGLAATERGHWEIANINLSFAEDTYTYARNALAGFSGFSASTISSLIGQNHYATAQGTTGFFFPYVGVGYLFGGEWGVTARNTAYPQFYLTNQWSHIIQTGAGFLIGTPKRSRHERFFEFRFGASGKLAIRKGGRYQIPYTDLTQISLTYLDSLTGAYGTSYGFDLGTQFI
jgi:hypothetical protein